MNLPNVNIFINNESSNNQNNNETPSFYNNQLFNNEYSNIESKDTDNEIKNPFDQELDIQNEIVFPDEFQSIFQIESKYHEVKFGNKPKTILPKNNKICLDPPVIYSFKDLVEIPSQIKKQGIKLEEFLKARIALEKQIETIGLSTEDDFVNNNNNSPFHTKVFNNDSASHLADEILSLQNYQIQKSQKELNEALIINDIYMQQPDLISPNNINPCRKSQPIYLDQLKCTYIANDNSKHDPRNTLSNICQHYKDSTFNVDQAMELLQELA